jgi:OOP family OmpA-OmpF porin
MNKLLPFLLLSLIGFSSLNAQIRLAIYGGLHSANVIETNNIPGWDTAVKKYYSARTGFHLGVLVEMPLGIKGLFFQPGIGYISKGRQYSKYNDSITAANTDTVYSQSTLELSYVEVPMYLTYKLPLSANHNSSFFISAGPYFAFFYSGTMNLQTQILSTNQYNSENDDLPVGNATGKYKTVDIGINAKAGFEIGNVMLSAFFSRGLSNFYTAPYDGEFHHQLVGATLGIWLAKANTHPQPKVRKDSDNDGIPDDEDLCPFQPGTAARHGCPVPDTDGDGIDDEHDSCKTVPGVAKYHGCPVPDTDGDGIDDEHDSCRTIPGVARYHGCPVPDTDGDGIDDEHDSCKTVPGMAKYNGCPIPDRDGDGVNDEVDKCPDQPGTAENEGCPLIEKEKMRFANSRVMFNSSSEKLTSSSFPSLDSLARILIEQPELHLTIEGYADNTGNASENLLLSQKRANAVRVYLMTKGVKSLRITAIGRGQEKPIADNSTDEGKAINRRVEFKFDEQKK